MINFFSGRKIPLALFILYTVITTVVFTALGFLGESLYNSYKLSLDPYLLSGLPLFSLMVFPVVLWLATLLQFFRYRKIFSHSWVFKVLWVAVGFPITYYIYYIAIWYSIVFISVKI